jgi:hypothetical protein
MPQISLYIDEPTLKQVERAAKKQKTSLSKWVVEQLKARLEPVYPDDYETLFGSIDDESFVEPDELSFSGDMKREPL